MIMTLVSCLGQNRYYVEIFLDMPVIGMISKILSIQVIQYAADMLFFVSPMGGGGRVFQIIQSDTFWHHWGQNV